jgi:flavorubredoxin
MREVNRTDYPIKDIDIDISEITDGIYRISGFSNTLGITFNQFLIDDEKLTLIHTGSIGMYKNIEQKIKEVISLQKLAYVSFLHFESDEWGGMEFLESAGCKISMQ